MLRTGDSLCCTCSGDVGGDGTLLHWFRRCGWRQDSVALVQAVWVEVRDRISVVLVQVVLVETGLCCTGSGGVSGDKRSHLHWFSRCGWRQETERDSVSCLVALVQVAWVEAGDRISVSPVQVVQLLPGGCHDVKPELVYFEQSV